MINIILRRTHILILAMEETDKWKTKTIEELLLFLCKSQTVTKCSPYRLKANSRARYFMGVSSSVQTMHIDLSVCVWGGDI